MTSDWGDQLRCRWVDEQAGEQCGEPVGSGVLPAGDVVLQGFCPPHTEAMRAIYFSKFKDIARRYREIAEDNPSDEARAMAWAGEAEAEDRARRFRPHA